MVQCCNCGGADDQRKCRHTGYCKSKECSFQKENPVGIKKIQGGTDTGYLSVPDEPVKDSGFQSLCKRKLCMLYHAWNNQQQAGGTVRGQSDCCI